MNLKLVASGLIFVLMFASCKKKEEEASIGTAYVGNWKMADVTCNGTTATVDGMAEYMSLSESSGRLVDYGSGCYASHNRFSISASGLEVVFANGSTSCAPTNCAIQYNLRVGSVTSSTQTYSCTSSIVSGSSVPYTMDGNGDLVGSDGQCSIRYTRTLDIPPNASCTNFDNGSLSATVTGGVSITANDTDVMAMQFATSTSKKLRAINILMESAGITEVTLRIYSGGATPQAGSLVGTVVKTTGLDKSSFTQHVFDLDSPLDLPAGNYYLVLSGKGSGSFDVRVNSTNLINSGQVWTFDGTNWNAAGVWDLNMGFVFDTPNCQ